jgi:CBS domain-containing protein
MSSAKQEWLGAARTAMEIEAASVSRAACRLDSELIRAADPILAHPGKVVVTGIGKSGHIARKIVATLCSTGTAAGFQHPAEAVHGDLSRHGATAERLALGLILRESHGTLAGVITDGDLRRALTNHDDIRGLCAGDVMTRTPVTIGPESSLGEALERMDRRPSQISVLPVADASGRALGLIRWHDIYRGVPLMCRSLFRWLTRAAQHAGSEPRP